MSSVRTSPRRISKIAISATVALAALPIGAIAAGASPQRPAAPASPKTVVSPTITALVSATPSGGSGNGYSNGGALSAEGRLVAWADDSNNLVPGDTNGATDVFVRDMVTDLTERVDVSTAGTQANGTVDSGPSMSRDGRYVVFSSGANNLVNGDTNAKTDVFVRDRKTATTQRVSVSSSEAQGDLQSWAPAISGNGRYVAFMSAATTLVTGDTNGYTDIFVRDLQLGTTARVSISSASAQATGNSQFPQISNDGRYVTFTSTATTLVANDTNGHSDVFLRDTTNNTTVRASLSVGGGQGLGDSGGEVAPVSDNGRYVTFASSAANLVANDTNGSWDVFRRDLLGDTTTRVDVSTASAQANASAGAISMSANGDVISFTTGASNLVAGDTNGRGDAFERTVSTGSTVRESVSTNGQQLADGASNAAISPDGSTVAFGSDSGDAVTMPAGAGTMFVRSKISVSPFITVTGLVQQQAADFGVTLTSAQRDAQVAKILSGFPSQQRYIADLARSASWAGKRGPVTRLYWAFFLREPDTGGITHWINKVNSGSSLSWVASNFASSSEFKTKYGSLDNTQFVTLVYQNVLGRNPDAAGLSHWVTKLTGGMSRGAMMTAFSESSEGKRKMAPQTDVVVLSLAMLHVVPTAPQFSAWRAVITNGGSLEDVVTQIMATPAYASRITP